MVRTAAAPSAPCTRAVAQVARRESPAALGDRSGRALESTRRSATRADCSSKSQSIGAWEPKGLGETLEPFRWSWPDPGQGVCSKRKPRPGCTRREVGNVGEPGALESDPQLRVQPVQSKSPFAAYEP